MSSWGDEIDAAVADFVTVAALAHAPIPLDAIEIEPLKAPHKPPARLPSGRMAIYAF